MQQRPSGELGRLEVVVGSVHLGVGAGLLARPAPAAPARAELALLHGLAAHGLD